MRLLLLSLLLLTSSLQAQTSVTLDRQEGPLNKIFELVLESEQRRPLPPPDFSVLERDFTVLNNNKVSVSNFRSGTNYYNSRWTIRLRPKRAGQLKIPGIRVGSERSRSLVYVALDTSEEAVSESLIVETSVEPDLGYARSALTLSVKLYFNQPLTRAELTEPELENVLIERLGPQRNYGEVKDGADYQVIEQRYALFPMAPGRYLLPPIEFIGADELQPLTAHSDELQFEAVSPPALQNGDWLAATELHLEDSWGESNRNTLRVGDTLIRTLTIEGHNVPARWLPTPRLPAVEGISIYPQAPQLSQSVDSGTLLSRKTIQYKLLLTKSGDLTLPALKLYWWDTVRDQQEISSLAATTLRVGNFSAQAQQAPQPISKPAIETKSNVAPTNSTESEYSDSWMSWLWALIALVCAAGWSLSRAKQQQLKQQLSQQQQHSIKRDSGLKERDYLLEETNAFNRLSRACSTNNCEEAAMQLIQWAKFSWPQEAISDLADVELYADDATLTYLLRDMEHHLYHAMPDDDPWQGDLILNQITRVRKRLKSGHRNAHSGFPGSSY